MIGVLDEEIEEWFVCGVDEIVDEMCIVLNIDVDLDFEDLFCFVILICLL